MKVKINLLVALFVLFFLKKIEAQTIYKISRLSVRSKAFVAYEPQSPNTKNIQLRYDRYKKKTLEFTNYGDSVTAIIFEYDTNRHLLKKDTLNFIKNYEDPFITDRYILTVMMEPEIFADFYDKIQKRLAQK